MVILQHQSQEKREERQCKQKHSSPVKKREKQKNLHKNNQKLFSSTGSKIIFLSECERERVCIILKSISG